MEPALRREDALVIVDVQNDFCPGGALAVPHGDEILPTLNRWIDAAVAKLRPVYASRDWHPPRHASFRERGGPWPAHCVQNTAGAEFHPQLRLPAGVRIISKGADPDRDDYSAFAGTELAALLRQGGVRRLFVGGLALDYCVRATVLDGITEDFEMHLVRDATRPVEIEPGDGARALAEIESAGAVIE